MLNPLLASNPLPPFSQIKPAHIEPAIDLILKENQQQIKALLENHSTYTWDNLLAPLADIEDRLSQAWSPVAHMNAVVNSDDLRQAYNACLPKLTDYGTELSQNEKLYLAIKQLVESDEYNTYSAAQKKVVENHLRDFRLAGIHLTGEEKARYKTVSRRLSELTAQFEENVLDATNAWYKQVTVAELAGLPEHSLALAKAAAESKGQTGYLVSLEFPSYLAVMTYADNRALRKEMYEAFVTRASDLGPTAGKYDNKPIIDALLACRYELAQLVGFETYADYSLALKMASDTDEVLTFLNDLNQRTHDKAVAEFSELLEFAKTLGQDDLKPWDMTYYAEKFRQARFDLDQDKLRPYFQLPVVLNGMFEIIHRLYGMQVSKKTPVDVWHEDVTCYEIHDAQGQLRGMFYLDLFARAHKRGGAWMDECRVRRRLSDDKVQTPVAYLVCNFSGPTADKPALLSHEEVLTLFHEFGHGLHHMLTQVDIADVSGINGVPWDAVELPSQFFENWCWQEEALQLISKHIETNETLPKDLFNKLLSAKHFQTAMAMVRQLEFSLFDFRLYHRYRGQDDFSVQALLDEVRSEVAVVPTVSCNRFQNSFSHIFAGGYSAGYYSYKWAEVLASDAFSRFEEEGVFSQSVGQAFLQTFLEQGGVREPMDLFIEFRGRKPSIDALLRHSGLV